MQILRLGLPIGFSLLVESSVFALIALFLAPLGALVVASHQITLNYSATVFYGSPEYRQCHHHPGGACGRGVNGSIRRSGCAGQDC